MAAIFAIALKDLRVMVRVKSGLFFAVGWPLIIAILFGAIYPKPGDNSMRRLAIVVADDDQSEASRNLLATLQKGKEFDLLPASRAEAMDLIRKGKRAAALILPKGFGEGSQQIFYGPPPKVEIWVDPSRKAEASMIEGMLYQKVMERFEKRFSDRSAMQAEIRQSLNKLNSTSSPKDPELQKTSRFLGNLNRLLDETPSANPTESQGASSSWKPLEVEHHNLLLQQEGPHSGFEITFPQGILWGVIGCAMSFGIGFVTERTGGTLLRLQISPLSRTQLLAGKGLACFMAGLLIQLLLFAVGRLGFKVIPTSWPLMFMAGISTLVAFVGIMMLVAGLGKTEQAAAGMGWALMMPLSLFGGAMMPLAFMPGWMSKIGMISPVRWGIMAFEGALWRGFSAYDMLLPCGILVAMGVICFAVGTRTLRLSES
jgi:ABC-2 type transport system permease protein